MTDRPDWRKSSYCGEGDACVHIAERTDSIDVADSTWTVVSLTPAAWTAFLRALRR
ncbi:DUF397 domain-containing protein [Streptomyces sp. NPDC048603]|uniref:DUF397 domain-containing protein n=1 Tax=Streptomyces sp. NPDC048603 TaxID=3365577 RepID=UPI0037158C69